MDIVKFKFSFSYLFFMKITKDDIKYACKYMYGDNAMLCDARIDDSNCPNYELKDFPLIDKCEPPDDLMGLEIKKIE